MTDDDADAAVPYADAMYYRTDAEDVKSVFFSDWETTVRVGITDETVAEFVDLAESVFDEMHADMAEIERLMRGDGPEIETEDAGTDADDLLANSEPLGTPTTETCPACDETGEFVEVWHDGDQLAVCRTETCRVREYNPVSTPGVSDE